MNHMNEGASVRASYPLSRGYLLSQSGGIEFAGWIGGFISTWLIQFQANSKTKNANPVKKVSPSRRDYAFSKGRERNVCDYSTYLVGKLMALFWNLYTHSHLPCPQISRPPEEREASYQHHQCLFAFRFLRTCTKLVHFLLQSKVQHDFGNNYIFLYRMLQIVSKILRYDKTSYNGYFLYSEIIITLCLIILWSSSYILMVSWRHAKRTLNILLNSWPWCKIPCIIFL